MSEAASYVKPVQIRWADLDPNVHLRHSVYYDYGAFSRISFFEEHGVSQAEMARLNIGPVLFHEEAVFRREVRMGDSLTISLELTRSRKDYSRWSISHRLVKNGDILAAVMTVDGAWLNTEIRKLGSPPALICQALDKMPRSADFVWL